VGLGREQVGAIRCLLFVRVLALFSAPFLVELHANKAIINNIKAIIFAEKNVCIAIFLCGNYIIKIANSRYARVLPIKWHATLKIICY
jgi:hypothetical protein